MTKKRFEKKDEKIKAYEEKKINEAIEFLKPYNEELSKQGVEIICSLVWCYLDEANEEKQLPEERVPIQKRKRYYCDLLFLFHYIGARDDNEDGQGFLIDHKIVEYDVVHYSLFGEVWAVRKYGIRWFLKMKIVKEINKIKENGFEHQLKKYAVK